MWLPAVVGLEMHRDRITPKGASIRFPVELRDVPASSKVG
jgi:hypothetical protein